MTFSIIGYDPETGDFGVAVQSKFIAVGSLVPWAKANVGAVATQAHANVSFGPRGLELVKQGKEPEEVLEELLKDDELREARQVAVISKEGAAAFTGTDCFYWAGHKVGENFSAQGNILTKKETIEALAEGFTNTKGDLTDKLMAALLAADKEGLGDVRGKQSAAILVVREAGGYGGYTDKLVDLRVDEHDEPIQELARIVEVYEMTMVNKEPEENLLDIKDDIANHMKDVLIELDYLDKEEASPGSEWNEVEQQAYEAWIGFNNFENRLKSTDTIWKSIYYYMKNEKGTPYFDLKKVSDIED